MKNRANRHEVAEAVRKYIRDRRPCGLTLEVVDGGIRQDQYWWYVPIRPSQEPQKLFEYYEALADVEEELEERDNLTVLLVPASP